ncbi:MAG: hypothetical protein ABIJ56_06960 [Pseudomonadota bacterium]
MKAATLLFAYLWLLASCGGGRSQEPAAPDKIVAQPAAETAPAPDKVGLTEEAAAGAWESPSCDKRKHARSLNVNKGGGFTLADLVAPCPPGKKCAWSGVNLYGGSWKIADGKLVLTYARPDDAKKKILSDPKEGLPAIFSLSGDGGKMSLVVREGDDAGCAYTGKPSP